MTWQACVAYFVVGPVFFEWSARLDGQPEDAPMWGLLGAFVVSVLAASLIEWWMRHRTLQATDTEVL